MATRDEISVHLLAPCGKRTNYKAEWVLPGTRKRKSKSLKTADPETAEKKRVALEYELNHDLYHEPGKVTWEVFRKTYESEKLAGLRANTQECARMIFDRFEREIAPRGVAEINERTIGEYVGVLRKAGLKPSTLDSHVKYIKAALMWAKRQKFIREVPTIEPIKLPRKKKIRTIDLPGLKVLLDSLTGRDAQEWRLLIQMAWYTGLRRTELHILRWDEEGEEAPWLDLAARRLWIPAAACKADEDSWLPLHPELLAILEPLAKERGRVFTLASHPCDLSHKFARRARAAGLKLTLHDLRRSFGSRYALVVPAQVLQRLMRHADIHTTLKYYVDLDHGLDEAITKA